MEIIILFIVISVISSVIKSIGKMQTAQQDTMGKAPPIEPIGETYSEEPPEVQPVHKMEEYTPSKNDKSIRALSKDESKISLEAPMKKRVKPRLDVKTLSHNRLVEGIV